MIWLSPQTYPGDQCQNGYMPLNVKQYKYTSLLTEVLFQKCLT